MKSTAFNLLWQLFLEIKREMFSDLEAVKYSPYSKPDLLQ